MDRNIGDALSGENTRGLSLNFVIIIIAIRVYDFSFHGSRIPVSLPFNFHNDLTIAIICF